MIDLVNHKRDSDEVEAEVRSDLAQYKSEIDAFHRLFYASRQTHGMTFFRGVPVLKNPLDLWVAQEIIWDLRPTLIIETGTAHGGSALFYASQMDLIGEGHVLSIDLEPSEHLPKHPRITYAKGESSLRARLLDAVYKIAASHPRVMVSLDSDHSMEHVRRELDAYAPLVTAGQFLIVEDTNLNGRPVPVDWKGGPGPGPAVDAWLPGHPEFARAVMAERYLMTFHTWLRRRINGATTDTEERTLCGKA